TYCNAFIRHFATTVADTLQCFYSTFRNSSGRLFAAAPVDGSIRNRAGLQRILAAESLLGIVTNPFFRYPHAVTPLHARPRLVYRALEGIRRVRALELSAFPDRAVRGTGRREAAAGVGYHGGER